MVGAAAPPSGGDGLRSKGDELGELAAVLAVAARRNSSRAPCGPRSRSRSSRRMRLRCANSISTFPLPARGDVGFDGGYVARLAGGDRSLPVRVRLDQARIGGEALAAHQPLGQAARNRRLEQPAQQVAVAEAADSAAVYAEQEPLRTWIGAAQLNFLWPPFLRSCSVA